MNTDLHPGFRARGSFEEAGAYDLLPLRFKRLDQEWVLVTNLIGEYLLLETDQFEKLTNGRLNRRDPVFKVLLAKHFVKEPGDGMPIELLRIKYQNKVDGISEFTGLHIFVVTLRCDHSCQYCQVSRQNDNASAFDMDRRYADKAVEWVFKTPNRNIKIEFQGGESLLNIELIRYIVEKSVAINQAESRNLQFVIATNLVFLDDEIIRFAEKYGIIFSTSLDGPEWLHNANRPRPGKNSYDLAVQGIDRIRRELGFDRVSALMTTTHRSLPHPEEIVDTYASLGFDGIFLRPLSPFGFAKKTKLYFKYNEEEWLQFYDRAIDHIISLNKRGVSMQEYYTAILARKMLTPYGTGYVDLQNPTGSGIGAVVFNYDGHVFASDEGRMLAETGDSSLAIGHLDHHSYDEVFAGSKLKSLLFDTMHESSPMCCDCVYGPWCGVDPAHHIATQSDSVGHKAFSGFCRRHMGLFHRIVTKMERDEYVRELYGNWAWR